MFLALSVSSPSLCVLSGLTVTKRSASSTISGISNCSNARAFGTSTVRVLARFRSTNRTPYVCSNGRYPAASKPSCAFDLPGPSPTTIAPAPASRSDASSASSTRESVTAPTPLGRG